MADTVPVQGDAVVAKKSYPYANLYQGNRGEVVEVGAMIRVRWVDSRGREQMHSFVPVQFKRYFNIEASGSGDIAGADSADQSPS